MPRYFDKVKQVEVRSDFDDIGAADVVALDDANPFFSPLPTGQRLVYINGVPTGLEPIPAISLADAKAEKRGEINAAADAAMAPVSSKYPRSEIDSWPVQVAEAAAYAADPAAATPFIDGLLGRQQGKTKTDIATKIQQNASNYKALAADVFGQRQALDDDVDNATTVAGIDAIVVSIVAVV